MTQMKGTGKFLPKEYLWFLFMLTTSVAILEKRRLLV